MLLLGAGLSRRSASTRPFLWRDSGTALGRAPHQIVHYRRVGEARYLLVRCSSTVSVSSTRSSLAMVVSGYIDICSRWLCLGCKLCSPTEQGDSGFLCTQHNLDLWSRLLASRFVGCFVCLCLCLRSCVVYIALGRWPSLSVYSSPFCSCSLFC